MQRFSDKVVLVTGGNSGLGKATAEAFAREGAKVVITARREELGQEVAAAIRTAGGEATFIGCDMTDEGQVRALIDRIMQSYGRLDCASNNAWAPPVIGELAALEAAQFDQEFALLRGSFLCMKHEISAMTAGSAIVNCSSIATQMAQPGVGAYAAAKTALESLTRTAAHECASKKIRVNSICTGSFETPMAAEYAKTLTPEQLTAILAKTAMRRYGKLDEFAASVLFLCSDGASFITGTNLLVDGGFHLT